MEKHGEFSFEAEERGEFRVEIVIVCFFQCLLSCGNNLLVLNFPSGRIVSTFRLYNPIVERFLVS